VNGPLRQLQPNRVRRHLTTGKRGDPGAAAHRHGGSRRHDRALAATYATIEPIRDVLLQMFMGEEFGPDPPWEGHLATEIGQAEVAVDAVLYEAPMPLRQMMALDVGDTLMLELRSDALVIVRCGEITLTKGRIGRFGRVGERVAVASPSLCANPA
jgi:flagellar motor switch protein FliM